MKKQKIGTAKLSLNKKSITALTHGMQEVKGGVSELSKCLCNTVAGPFCCKNEKSMTQL